MKPYKKDYLVEKNHAASVIGSGDLEVLATPALIGFAENACKDMVLELLSADETTVGIFIQIEHLKASRIGATVKVEAELLKHEKRRFDFQVKVYEKKTLIASGTHQRVAVNRQRFLEKL
ncbi:thioesterase family protein [Vagococcus elongatus]|uniref:Fluoroacetyl-CoA-specific thioesterase-like domain-containing protein n=1 Tax=Vagococcus elongatus TaxID=180344 RepID=A0A430B5L4_9ENTE|nr:thioesterase family protein [Vagococcus elongatus]RSU15587.1 hypothetical protein CBF29_00495 [Vagococcus elongatus]